jgi:hypothetical protein
MTEDFTSEALEGIVLSAVAHEGLTAKTADGTPLQLAFITEDGRIVGRGDEVAQAAWRVAIESYRNFLKGMGHIRVHSEPPPG